MKDLSLHILDILQNSISAEASLIQLHIEEDLSKDKYLIRFIDNGKGMNDEMLAKVADPFTTTRTTRKVGLGLPLIKQNAERTGGYVSIRSKTGKGTEVEVLFKPQNIDMLPTGDLAGTISLTFTSHPEIEFIYTHTTPTGQFELNTKEIKKTLGTVPINTPQVVLFIKELIEENLKEINAR